MNIIRTTPIRAALLVSVLVTQQFIAGQGIQMTWQENVQATQDVLVVPEFSADLAEWIELPATTGSETSGVRTRSAFLPIIDGPSRTFVRLRFEN